MKFAITFKRKSNGSFLTIIVEGFEDSTFAINYAKKLVAKENLHERFTVRKLK